MADNRDKDTLKEKNAALVADLDNLHEEPPVQDPPVTPTPPEPDVTPTDPPANIPPVTPEEPPVVVKKEDKPVVPPLSPEQRFVHSQREAIIANGKNDQFISVVEEAATLPEPTEAELTKKYPSWPDMDDTTKMIAKENYINSLRFSKINEAVQATKEVDKHAKKIDAFLVDEKNIDKYKQLVGKEEAFKRFAMKPTHRGVDMDILVKSFIFDIPAPVQPKGSLLNRGNGGAPEKPKEYNEDDLQALRLSNPREYKRVIQSGKANVEI